MPIPIILWGAAAALAATGVVKSVQAKNNFNEAEETGKNAEKRYDNALESLEKDRIETQKILEKLGAIKVQAFTNQIKHLVNLIEKGKSQISGFDINITTDELQELGSSALSTSGFRMAGGMLALGAIALTPALAIGGFMMASKAEEARKKADEYSEKVDKAIAEIEITKTNLKGIRSNAAEISTIIKELTKRFDEVKVNDTNDQKAFSRMLEIGKGIKTLLDINIIEKNGDATKGIKSRCQGLLKLTFEIK